MMGHARFGTLGFAIVLVASIHTACSNRYEEECALTSRCEAGQSGSGGGTAGSGAAAGVSGNGSGGWSSGAGGEANAGSDSVSGSGGSEAEGGQAGIGGSGGSCDLSASPREEVCVLEQGAAIYVSPSGSDKNSHNGTRGYPVKSLGRALSLATAAKLPIVVCAGAYPENVTITEGARIYGGFDCETWTKGEMPTVVKPASGVALTVRGVSGMEQVKIEGVEFHAESASEAGGSSIAAVIEQSKVELRESRLVAGDGKDGAPGAEPVAYSGRAESGNPGTSTNGGAAKECTCGTETTKGGNGGAADSDGSGPNLPEGGGDGTPDWNGSNAGKGGDGASSDCVEGLGRSGAAGPDGTVGEGATKRGSFTAEDGYKPEPGKPGSAGKVGQGGGGGRGGENGGGGGGGCGGCGGKGGEPGQGGGASIALLAIDSEVTLPGTHLVVGKAGQGGAGAAGQAGQLGGGAGQGSGGFACPGGAGGPGGKGAAGGGGAGGIAVGILYQGTEPVADAEGWFTAGEAGEGGEGGDAEATEDDGRDGGESVGSLSITEL